MSANCPDDCYVSTWTPVICYSAAFKGFVGRATGAGPDHNLLADKFGSFNNTNMKGMMYKPIDNQTKPNCISISPIATASSAPTDEDWVRPGPGLTGGGVRSPNIRHHSNAATPPTVLYLTPVLSGPIDRYNRHYNTARQKYPPNTILLSYFLLVKNPYFDFAKLNISSGRYIPQYRSVLSGIVIQINFPLVRIPAQMYKFIFIAT